MAAIQAAESRVARSVSDARDGLLRAKSAFRVKLAQPSSLALAVAAGAVLAVTVARRPGSTAGRKDVVRAAPAVGMAAGALVRYGMQYLPIVLGMSQTSGREK